MSGQGSNLDALLRSELAGAFAGKVVLVVSDRPDVRALQSATTHGSVACVIRPKDFVGRDAWDEALTRTMISHSIDFVVCAGFKRVLGARMLATFPLRIINIHPSLLPSFPGGLHAQSDALSRGVKVAGCSVHFVTDEIDAGPIISQAAVVVEDDDTLETLSARILLEEHRLLPEAVRLLVADQLVVEGRRVRHRVPSPRKDWNLESPSTHQAFSQHLGA